MGFTTGISWTDATWNPIRGCSRVSQGCVHCYAETVAARFSGPGKPYAGLIDRHGRWNGKIAFIEKHLLDPLRWKQPKKIFVNSMSDLFHENLPFDQIDRIFAVMALADHHVFQVLTKRPERMREYFSYCPGGAMANGTQARVAQHAMAIARDRGEKVDAPYWDLWLENWPLPHIWLGTSAENYETFVQRWAQLREVPAAVRWISGEPLLGDLCLSLISWRDAASGRVTLDEPGKTLDWVVLGGESGSGHRAMELAWATSAIDACRRAAVPIWMKQDAGSKPGKQGRIPDEYFVHDFPVVPA